MRATFQPGYNLPYKTAPGTRAVPGRIAHRVVVAPTDGLGTLSRIPTPVLITAGVVVLGLVGVGAWVVLR